MPKLHDLLCEHLIRETLDPIRYLFDEEPDLSPDENTITTELRQRWEREKAELRAEGKAEAILSVLIAGL